MNVVGHAFTHDERGTRVEVRLPCGSRLRGTVTLVTAGVDQSGPVVRAVRFYHVRLDNGRVLSTRQPFTPTEEPEVVSPDLAELWRLGDAYEAAFDAWTSHTPGTPARLAAHDLVFEPAWFAFRDAQRAYQDRFAGAS